MKVKERLALLEQLEQSKKEQKIIQEQQESAIKEQEQEFGYKIYSARSNKVKALKEDEKFKADVKTMLLAECLNAVIYPAICENVDVEKYVPLQIIKSEIQECGVDKMLRDIKYKSYLLSEMYVLVNEYSEILLEKAKQEESKRYELKIDNEVDQMIDELDMEEVRKAAAAISDRVSDSVSNFIKANAEDKARVNAIMDKAQEDVNKTVNESLISSYNKQAKQAIGNIKYNRDKSIFEQVVHRISKTVLNDDVLKESYIENNKLNFDKIIEAAVVHYTILEAHNTLRTRDIDLDYIKEYFSL